MKYYCIGIKGAGMSTLANILYDLGNEVEGYDDAKEYKFTMEGLNKRGIPIYYEAHDLDKDTIVTFSKAFSQEHKEIKRVKELGLTIKNYNEVLELKEQAEKEIKKSLDEFLKLEKFIFNMDEMYKVADLCITRAGAMTISELALSHKPSILIPLPFAAENHQFFNAKVLESVKAAKIIEQKDLTEDTLNSAVLEIISNNNIEKMGENASKVIVKDVEEKIYNCIKLK